MGGVSPLHKEYIEDHDQREYKESLRVHQKAIATKTTSSLGEGRLGHKLLVTVKRVPVNRETYECDDIIVTLNGRVQKYVVESAYNLQRGSDNMP